MELVDIYNLLEMWFYAWLFKVAFEFVARNFRKGRFKK